MNIRLHVDTHDNLMVKLGAKFSLGHAIHFIWKVLRMSLIWISQRGV